MVEVVAAEKGVYGSVKQQQQQGDDLQQQQGDDLHLRFELMTQEIPGTAARSRIFESSEILIFQIFIIQIAK